MTNEELQTLIKNACKAAGWRIKRIGPVAGMVSVWIDDAPVIVKLADDDGDSRMLQVACRIDMFFNNDLRKNGHEVVTAFHDDERGYSHSEPISDDAHKSARLAVLRCAAMIGEAME